MDGDAAGPANPLESKASELSALEKKKLELLNWRESWRKSSEEN